LIKIKLGFNNIGCCGLKTRDENPVMTFPIKNCLLIKGQSYVNKIGSQNFLAKLKRVKMLAP